MIQTHPSTMTLDPGLATAGPSRQFVRQDVWAVAAALRSCQGWAVEEHVAYDGLVTIVATSAEADVTLFLSGTVDQPSVAKVSGDTLQELGTFCCMEDAVVDLVKAV